jgi:hypothetical protein
MCRYCFVTSALQAEKLGYTDRDEYCVDHRRRGTAIIINNKDFHSSTGRKNVASTELRHASLFVGLNTRDGTNLDASRLEGTFLGLDFDTEVYHNRTATQILNIVEQGNDDRSRHSPTLLF